MTRHQLIAVGRACFGESWIHDVARELRVSDRSVRYWVSGNEKHPIPHDLAPRLLAMTVRRREIIFEAGLELFEGNGHA